MSARAPWADKSPHRPQYLQVRRHRSLLQPRRQGYKAGRLYRYSHEALPGKGPPGSASMAGGLLRTCGVPLDCVNLVPVALKSLERLRLPQLAHMDNLVCAAGRKTGVVPPIHVQRGRCIDRGPLRRWTPLFSTLFCSASQHQHQHQHWKPWWQGIYADLKRLLASHGNCFSMSSGACDASEPALDTQEVGRSKNEKGTQQDIECTCVKLKLLLDLPRAAVPDDGGLVHGPAQK